MANIKFSKISYIKLLLQDSINKYVENNKHILSIKIKKVELRDKCELLINYECVFFNNNRISFGFYALTNNLNFEGELEFESYQDLYSLLENKIFIEYAKTIANKMFNTVKSYITNTDYTYLKNNSIDNDDIINRIDEITGNLLKSLTELQNIKKNIIKMR